MSEPALSAISLFAGCGGSDLGMREAGVETEWANDIDENACALYESLGSGPKIEHGDIRKIDKFPKVDIVAGCYPCQGYSQGGVREASASINYLYREFDRVLRKVRPQAFIVENVDGMRFDQNAPLLENQYRRYRAAGYVVEGAVLDAKDYGLAQTRRRIFLVGIRTKERKRFEFPKPTHGPGRRPYRTLRDVIWKYRQAAEGDYCAEPLHWYYLSRNRRKTWGEQSACIVGHWRYVGLHPDSPPLRKLGPDAWEFTRDPHKARRLSYLECAALQGFSAPTRFRGAPIRARFRAIGNAVPPPLFKVVATALVRQLRTPARRS